MVVFYGEIRATAVSAEWSSANCEVEEKKCAFSDTPSPTVLGLHLLYTATAEQYFGGTRHHFFSPFF